ARVGSHTAAGNQTAGNPAEQAGDPGRGGEDRRSPGAGRAQWRSTAATADSGQGAGGPVLSAGRLVPPAGRGRPGARADHPAWAGRACGKRQGARRALVSRAGRPLQQSRAVECGTENPVRQRLQESAAATAAGTLKKKTPG